MTGDFDSMTPDEQNAYIERIEKQLDQLDRRGQLVDGEVPWRGREADDSIADWYSTTARWAEILGPADWTLVRGDGDSDGSRWRHPTATSAHSATTRYGCLFVYSPNTPFEVTYPDEAHGYTRFRAFAVLDHGGDLSAAGRAARELKNGDRPPPDDPEGDGERSGIAGDHDDLVSWHPVDLTAALSGDKARPAPTILRRSDGRCLLYEGQVNYLHGADGVGKSFVGLFAAVEVLNDGGHVVWLDWEDPDETTVVGRLRDLGVAAEVVAERFHYVHPETEATPAAVALVCDLVREVGARLVVVDSVGEALGIDSVNEDRDNEVTPWMRRVLRPLAAIGAAVLPIDHGIKSGDNPLHPSGSKRKRAQVTGAHYLVEAPRPISQEYNGGQLKLTTAKDRHGNYTRGKVAAIIDVTIYPDGGWTVHVHPPAVGGDGAANDRALARAVVRVVKQMQAETGHPPSMTQIEQSKRVRARNAAKRAAVEYACQLGALAESEGPRKARLFSYVKDVPQ